MGFYPVGAPRAKTVCWLRDHETVCCLPGCETVCVGCELNRSFIYLRYRFLVTTGTEKGYELRLSLCMKEYMRGEKTLMQSTGISVGTDHLGLDGEGNNALFHQMLNTQESLGFDHDVFASMDGGAPAGLPALGGGGASPLQLRGPGPGPSNPGAALQQLFGCGGGASATAPDSFGLLHKGSTSSASASSGNQHNEDPAMLMAELVGIGCPDDDGNGPVHMKKEDEPPHDSEPPPAILRSASAHSTPSENSAGGMQPVVSEAPQAPAQVAQACTDDVLPAAHGVPEAGADATARVGAGAETTVPRRSLTSIGDTKANRKKGRKGPHHDPQHRYEDPQSPQSCLRLNASSGHHWDPRSKE